MTYLTLPVAPTSWRLLLSDANAFGGFRDEFRYGLQLNYSSIRRELLDVMEQVFSERRDRLLVRAVEDLHFKENNAIVTAYETITRQTKFLPVKTTGPIDARVFIQIGKGVYETYLGMKNESSLLITLPVRKRDEVKAGTELSLNPVFRMTGLKKSPKHNVTRNKQYKYDPISFTVWEV